MKSVVLLLSLMMSSLTFAGNTPSSEFMSLEKQNEIVVKAAKAFRRNLWVNGYEDVHSSDSEFVNTAFLNEYLNQPYGYESELNSDEVEAIELCIEKLNCEPYYFATSSNYWGGYGSEGTFVLVYTESGKYFSITHTIYAE